jgi:hypothetical protein
MPNAPQEIIDLVETFQRNQRTLISSTYSED